MYSFEGSYIVVDDEAMAVRDEGGERSAVPTGQGKDSSTSDYDVEGEDRVVFVNEDEFMDSPVGGLVSPFSKEGEFVGVSPISTGVGSRPPLKSALSTSAMDVPKDDSLLKRNVSWADFSDGVALTTVVEFERDPLPSSPTSIDSWEDGHEGGCACCTVM